nr:CAAX prenyl protease-related protein [Duganella sp. BJB1802]
MPFLTYMVFIAVADLLARAGLTPGQLRWLYPLKIGLVALLLLRYWPEYRELRPARLGPAAAALAAAAGVLVFVLWIGLDAGWMVVGRPTGYDPRGAGALTWPLMLVRLAGAALVVPVMEELFWRSYLMRWLTAEDFAGVAPAQLKFRGFIVTVILFGVEHNQWLAGMVAGAVYGLLYMRTGKLWVAIAAHAVTNGVLGVWIIRTGSWAYW